jgi:DNA ligase-associated metallophosphoesterase
MSGHGFDYHGLRLVARGSGVLWWPEGGLLVVADLHLGKSERLARRGGPLLPPYEGLATLERLAAEVDALAPQVIVSLGDAFDDMAAVPALDEAVLARLQALARARDWIWLAGNHDPAVPQGLPGRLVGQLALGRAVLCHEPCDTIPEPQICGHFHPVVRLAGERRRAFLLGARRLILPAFGAYTGGLDCDDPALAAVVPRGLAIACGSRPLVLPVGASRPSAAIRRRR